jgi:PAS domain S-box-containing protein
MTLHVASDREPTEDDDVRAALDAVPVAAVIADADGRPIWANRVAAQLAEGDDDLRTSRLYTELARCAPAAGARAEQRPTQGRVQLPTNVGLIERLVTASPLPTDAALVVVSFSPPDPATADDDTTLRERLDAMLEHTSDIITVLDRDGSILFSNAAAGRLTGLTGAEVNGRLALDLIHPDDMDVAAAALAAALQREGPGEKVELRVRFADDRWHVVEVSMNNMLGVQPIDGIVVTVHDVTDRKAMETRLESLIANLSDIIVVLDENFAITYASDSISHLIDAPPATNLGMNAFNDIHPDDVVAAIDTLTHVRDSPVGTAAQVEVRIESRPNTERWRRVVATAVNKLTDPAIGGIVVTLRDVTEEKAAVDALQAAYERERTTADRLRELDRLKDDFLATVSHELRTPLATIVGFADLLGRGGVEPATQADLLTRIAASATEMRSMIDNVLDFSALEAGRVALSVRAIDVRDVIDTAMTTVGHQLRKHVVHDEVVEGSVVLADAHGLGHVVRNFLTNAARYSDAGTVITIAVERTDATTRITVADEGVGIPDEDHERIFERFYRAPSAAFVARGSGIGLNIARRYAELMGGQVGVESAPGRGSRFFVTLPAA